MDCAAGQNDLQAGVFEVRRRFERTLRDKPQALRISRNCQTTLWEIGRYRREDREDGRFAVVSRDDHLCDAIRYVCAQHPTSTPTPSRRRARTRHWQPNVAPPMRPRVRGETPPLGAMS
jgi:hypothetical protein